MSHAASFSGASSGGQLSGGIPGEDVGAPGAVGGEDGWKGNPDGLSFFGVRRHNLAYALRMIMTMIPTKIRKHSHQLSMQNA